MGAYNQRRSQKTVPIPRFPPFLFFRTIAKYHESEIADRVMGEGNNLDGSISVPAARLADMIDLTELLRMASESPKDIPALPEEKEVAGWPQPSQIN